MPEGEEDKAKDDDAVAEGIANSLVSLYFYYDYRLKFIINSWLAMAESLEI